LKYIDPMPRNHQENLPAACTAGGAPKCSGRHSHPEPVRDRAKKLDASTPLLASIIISSYNYGRYLRETIDSCLDQTYPDLEIIVVDDGSTDNSQDLIHSYGHRIRAFFKENGGHASALNLGFEKSKGDVVIFLDSDDALMPTALEKCVPLFRDPHVSTVRWQMWTMDPSSRVMAKRVPPDKIAQGDLREELLREGPHHFPPTSGNAWARWFLERVMPIPEELFRLGGGDLYLATLAALYGSVRATEEPQGLYRIHTDKYTLRESFEERLALFVAMWDGSLDALARHARSLGVRFRVGALKRKGWWRRIARAVEDLRRVVPAGATYILVEDDYWGSGNVIPGACRRSFLDRVGCYWGPPGNDATAIQALEDLRGQGASFLAFAWSSYWWFQHFPGFSKYLRSHYPCVLRNTRLTVFDLNGGVGTPVRGRQAGKALSPGS
jgi:glycosyltransferase involved in cell wall biosynthesis